MDVLLEQHRAHLARTTWHLTRHNPNERAAGERGHASYYHFNVDLGYVQPMSLREGRVRIGISGRTKHGRDVYVERDFHWIENHRLFARSRTAKARKVLSAAPRGETHASNGWAWMATPGLREAGKTKRNGFTAVRNTCLDPDHSIVDRCMCTMERG
jgi:hypothetical protein